jgi:hypothetical protein
MRFKLLLDIRTKLRQPPKHFADGFQIVSSLDSAPKTKTHSLGPDGQSGHRPMCFTQSGISWKPGQRGGISNKLSSRDGEPKVNAESELHFSKQRAPMDSIDAGMKIDRSSSHPPKTGSPKGMSCESGKTVTFSSEWHQKKRSGARTWADDGIAIDFSAEQWANALSSIRVNVEPGPNLNSVRF